LNFLRQKQRKAIDRCDVNEIDAQPLTTHDVFDLESVNQTGFYKHFTIDNITLLESAIACPSDPVT
jgi:hypothetical protein